MDLELRYLKAMIKLLNNKDIQATLIILNYLVSVIEEDDITLERLEEVGDQLIKANEL